MMYGTGATDSEIQKVRAETKEIKLKMAADQTELNALMVGQTPDSKRVRELSESIAANQLTLEERYSAYGNGRGRMNGNHMRGPGMMNNGYHGCNW